MMIISSTIILVNIRRLDHKATPSFLIKALIGISNRGRRVWQFLKSWQKKNKCCLEIGFQLSLQKSNFSGEEAFHWYGLVSTKFLRLEWLSNKFDLLIPINRTLRKYGLDHISLMKVSQNQNLRTIQVWKI